MGAGEEGKMGKARKEGKWGRGGIDVHNEIPINTNSIRLLELLSFFFLACRVDLLTESSQNNSPCPQKITVWVTK